MVKVFGEPARSLESRTGSVMSFYKAARGSPAVLYLVNKTNFEPLRIRITTFSKRDDPFGSNKCILTGKQNIHCNLIRPMNFEWTSTVLRLFRKKSKDCPTVLGQEFCLLMFFAIFSCDHHCIRKPHPTNHGQLVRFRYSELFIVESVPKAD